MKKARMNISHSRFILSKLKIFGEIVTTVILSGSMPKPKFFCLAEKWENVSNNKLWKCVSFTQNNVQFCCPKKRKSVYTCSENTLKKLEKKLIHKWLSVWRPSAIDGLQLRHSFFPPKRLDVKMPLQSIGRYRKSTYNSFSGHIWRIWL